MQVGQPLINRKVTAQLRLGAPPRRGMAPQQGRNRHVLWLAYVATTIWNGAGAGQGWMSSLANLVESHNQQGTGQNADWGNLTNMVGHYNAAQSSGGGLQDFQNKCARKALALHSRHILEARSAAAGVITSAGLPTLGEGLHVRFMAQIRKIASA